MLSLSAQFLAWCRSKPAGEEYDYYDIFNCACCQFGHEMGVLDESLPFVSSEPVHLLQSKFGVELHATPWTFGALADRLADRVERQLAEQVTL